MDKLSLLSWPTASESAYIFLFLFYRQSIIANTFFKRNNKTLHLKRISIHKGIVGHQMRTFCVQTFFFLFFFPLETFSTLSFSKKRRSCFFLMQHVEFKSYSSVVSASFVEGRGGKKPLEGKWIKQITSLNNMKSAILNSSDTYASNKVWNLKVLCQGKSCTSELINL